MSNSIWSELLGGDTLLDQHARVSTAVLDSAQVVLLQFSSGWCGPCRQFTPLLRRVYEQVNGAAAAGARRLEVILVSLDNDERAFQRYYAGMPWLAVPHAQAEAIATRYNVQSIPAVLMLDARGHLHGAEGVRVIKAAPEQFPWLASLQPQTDDDDDDSYAGTDESGDASRDAERDSDCDSYDCSDVEVREPPLADDADSAEFSNKQ